MRPIWRGGTRRKFFFSLVRIKIYRFGAAALEATLASWRNNHDRAHDPSLKAGLLTDFPGIQRTGVGPTD